MELKSFVAQGGNGKILTTATARVFLQGTDTVATGFVSSTDQAITFPVAVDANGMVSFKGPDGVYDLQFENEGIKGPRFPMQLNDPANILRKGDVEPVASFAALRTRVPAKDGEVVHLISYNDDWKLAGRRAEGGGRFIGYKKAGTDDGGVIAAGSNFYWQRDCDYSKLTVVDFGAKSDGTTDCAPACLRMYNWAKSKGEPLMALGLQFPPGDFALGKFDVSAAYIGKFRLAGNPNSYGYFGSTRLKLIGANDEYAVTVNARQVDISWIIINGQSVPAKNGQPANLNTRRFFKNVCIEGEFHHANYWRAHNCGGVVFDISDSLDTKFHEFYAADCQDTVLRGSFSNSATGSWFHSTAVELSNFNIQSCSGPNPALDFQRCTQSLLDNGWIEKTNNPGDLSNGQWVIKAFSMEGCTVPFNLTHCQLVMLGGLNLQTGSSITYDDPTKTELAPLERGRLRLENHGLQAYGSIAYNYLHSLMRFNNPTAVPVWINVGLYKVQSVGDTVKLRFNGAHQENSAPTAVFGANNFGGGELVCTLRRPSGTAKQEGSVEVFGSPAIQDIAFSRPWENDMQIFVQLKPNSGWVNLHIETTTHSRFTAGTPFIWNYYGKQITDDEFKAFNVYRPRNAAAWGTLKAGIAIMESGHLNITGRATVDDRMQLNVNGKNYLVALEKEAWMSDGFMRLGTIGSTNNDNYLSGAFVSTWGTAGTLEGGAETNNGQLVISNKSAAAIAMGIQQTDYDIRFKIVSGPANTGTDVQTTFDFRRPTGATGVDGYRIAFMAKDASGVNTLRLYKRVSGVSTVISQADATITDGQTLRIVMQGQRIMIYADKALLWDITDPSITGGRVVGFGTGTNNAGLTVSDFRMYTLG